MQVNIFTLFFKKSSINCNASSYVFSQNFHTSKLGETKVFHEVNKTIGKAKQNTSSNSKWMWPTCTILPFALFSKLHKRKQSSHLHCVCTNALLLDLNFSQEQKNTLCKIILLNKSRNILLNGNIASIYNF